VNVAEARKTLFDIGGKLVVITGCAGGVGTALCAGFKELGARVVGADMKAGKDEGRDILPFDLRDRRSIHALAAQVEKEYGPVDVLINNAAAGGGGPAEELTEGHWDEVIAANLTGTFACAQAFGRGMIERRRGKIINLASACGIFGYPFSAGYNASKAGIWSVTQTLAVEWSRFNIQINAIVPGFVETPMNEKALKDPVEMKIHTGLIPAGRISVPQDLVGPAAFLSSGASDYVNGAMLVVDGGAVTAGGATALRDLYVSAR
jgi:NAD(P)-dependent dehydrogenase (short-subunit alcohol dehydrogenase family)